MDVLVLPRKIYHRNDMRPALIDMNLPAKRLLYMCLAKIKRKSTVDNVVLKFDSNNPFKISVKDYAELCDIDYSAAYRQMVEGVKELRGYVLEADNSLVRLKNKELPEDWIEPFTIADKVFRAKGKKTISKAESHTLVFGDILDGDELVDEVLISVFSNPKSFTGEDSVEI